MTSDIAAVTPTTIRDVRVFDGERLGDPTDVVLADGAITSIAARDISGGVADGAVVDGAGGCLLPGLIDAHVHVDTLAQFEQAAQWGVTTMLDMGCRDRARVAAFTAGRPLPTLRSAGKPASAPGSMAVTTMGFDPLSAVSGPHDAARFVADRVAEGSDYVKILVEDPKIPRTKALDEATITALVEAAHAAGLKAVAHIVSADTLRTALRAGADVVTHTALTSELGPEFDSLLERPVVLIPTLTMMDGVRRAIGGKFIMRVLRPFVPAVRMDYAHAKATVARFQRAGAVVLVGTDANDDHTAPFQVAHGEAVHEELARLVDAGLSPVEALRGATSATASAFGMPDRGRVAPGMRADLLLVDGDPTTDISTTRNVRGVWIGGARTR